MGGGRKGGMGSLRRGGIEKLFCRVGQHAGGPCREGPNAGGQCDMRRKEPREFCHEGPNAGGESGNFVGLSREASAQGCHTKEGFPEKKTLKCTEAPPWHRQRERELCSTAILEVDHQKRKCVHARQRVCLPCGPKSLKNKGRHPRRCKTCQLLSKRK